MKKFLDSLFSAIWKITEYEYSFVVVLGLILLVVFISYVAQCAQFNRATKDFINETYNAKTFRVFEKFKRRSIFPQSAVLHDQCCCILSAMHLEKGNVAAFFENMNAVKNITEKFSWRVYLLLAAYLTDENYHNVAAAHSARAENQSTDEAVEQFLLAYDRVAILDKAAIAKENITQRQILEILLALTSAGDSSQF